MGQRLPTGKNICWHRVKEHHQIRAGVAVQSGEPLCHSEYATADRNSRRWRLDQAR